MLADGGMMIGRVRERLSGILVASFSIAISPARGSQVDRCLTRRRSVSHRGLHRRFNRHERGHAWLCPLPGWRLHERDRTYLHGRKDFEARFTELFAGRLKTATGQPR